MPNAWLGCHRLHLLRLNPISVQSQCRCPAPRRALPPRASRAARGARSPSAARLQIQIQLQLQGLCTTAAIRGPYPGRVRLLLVPIWLARAGFEVRQRVVPRWCRDDRPLQVCESHLYGRRGELRETRTGSQGSSHPEACSGRSTANAVGTPGG